MRIVSGIQPTGNLHLGNYLGAIRNWVRMQDELDEGSECLFFLADMHAISMPHDPAELRRGTLEMESIRRVRSCSTRRRFRNTWNCNGCSTAPPGWVG